MMSTNTGASAAVTGSQPASSRPLLKAVVRMALYLLVSAAILFGTAGTFNWLGGWLFVGLMLAGMVFSLLVVFPRHPDLVDERADAHQNTKAWDRWLSTPLILLTVLVPLLVAGLDRRFGWSPALPPALQAVGVAFYLLGYAIAQWAAATNRFYSRVVRIQTERGHTVVTGGPYRYVRHPGYVGNVVNLLTMPLIFGSLWVFVTSGVALVGLVVRTVLEDRTLRDELPGYAEYAQRTRFRLIPGLW